MNAAQAKRANELINDGRYNGKNQQEIDEIFRLVGIEIASTPEIPKVTAGSDMKKKIILCFKNIATADKVKWRRAIRMALESIPKEHLTEIPDIYVYNTTMKALTDTFNPDSDRIDSLGEKYLSSKVWGFSYLNDPSERNPKIDENSRATA